MEQNKPHPESNPPEPLSCCTPRNRRRPPRCRGTEPPIGRRAVLAVLLPAVLCASGCVTRSPILLNEKMRKTNPNRLALKVGLALDLSEELSYGRISTILTVPFMIPPFPIMKAAMPRINETEYLTFSMRDYLRDNDLFEYVYPPPFDPNDVDLVLKFKVEKCVADNFFLYSSGIHLMDFLSIGFFPLALVRLLVLPQERFSTIFDCTLEVCLPNGRTIATYNTVPGKQSEWVWIYQQPHADYLWYKSIFRKRFLEVMDEFRSSLERERNVLIKASEEYKRQAP